MFALISKMSKLKILLTILVLPGLYFFQQKGYAQKSKKRSISEQKPFGIDTVKENYFETSFFRYENYTYNKNIKTVQLHEKSFELSSPLLVLNSDQQLKLSFDDFGSDYKSYNYTLIHCSSDWQPTDISTQDYISGFPQDFLTDYKYSYNSIQAYIHYNLLFPNDNMKITKSGNYILKVYQDNDPDKYVISRRFMVVEERIGITAQVKPATIINERYYKQEIDFTIDYTGYEITNPYGDVKAVITQNDRWDNAVTTLKPLFVRENQLIYDYDEENVFPGGSEFRFFDMRSFRYQTERVKKITYDSLQNHVYLLDDEKRTYKRFVTLSDINGKYLIKVQEGTDSEREADYAFVHFFLPFDPPTTEGVLYVFGALSDWSCSEKNKLQYNYERKGYECIMYLKQGYYNYEYVFLKDGEYKADNTFIEGMHYETENDYVIYFYHHALGTRYDQLIGVKKINSQR